MNLFWTAITIGVSVDLIVGLVVTWAAIRHARKRDGR